MTKLAIVHYHPLELYPPVLNLIRFISKKIIADKLVVYTTLAEINISLVQSPSSDIVIKRLSRSGDKWSGFKRYYNYLRFYFGCTFSLIRQRPERVLYYETISSFPVFIYKKYFNRKAQILIHYHEYSSPEEYKNGMKLVMLFHGYERYLYPKANWVSHTNEYRMEQFIADIKPVRISNKQILPNYPPHHWCTPPASKIELPVKIIYVGALSLDTMYSREFAEWVIKQNGNVSWDIYSLNITDEVSEYFKSLSSVWINIMPGINYDALPAIIKNYNVGVVLYNGHIENFINNAPNKLFEYLACGLDVWFPVVMTGSLPYVTKASFPNVMAIDFTALSQLNLVNAINRSGYSCKPTNFFCENVLGDITNVFLKND